MEDFKSKNIESFSSVLGVEAYSNRYIRSSEEYVIKKYMKAGSYVLDVGCGTGRTTSYIFENGCKVIGVDLSEPLIKKAKEMYPKIDFEVMDAAKLRFPSETFDTVFFSFNGIDNFSSLPDRHEAIKELLRALKTGGFFIYSSHNSIAMPRTFQKLKSRIKDIKKFGIGPHWREADYGFGKLFQYYNNVWNEKKQLKSIGLNIVEVISNGKVSKLPKIFLPFLERFPTYVIKKL